MKNLIFDVIYVLFIGIFFPFVYLSYIFILIFWILWNFSVDRKIELLESEKEYLLKLRSIKPVFFDMVMDSSGNPTRLITGTVYCHQFASRETSPLYKNIQFLSEYDIFERIIDWNYISVEA